MHQISSKLWVGSDADFAQLDQYGTEWAIVHAAKTWHKTVCGYTTNAAPKDAEYYVALRGKRLALNLIDAPDPKFVPKELVDTALAFITANLAGLEGAEQLLIHCNQGHSRAPTLGMLYIASTLPEDFEAAEVEYRKLCPDYAPGNGMREFARANWAAYRGRNSETSDPDLDKARELVERFGQDITTAPDKAVTNLISSIACALKHAGANKA